MITKKIIFSLLAITFATHAEAQLANRFSVNGLGRSFITKNDLSGNILDNDSKTKSAGVGGYNLFDLQSNLNIDSAFQAMATYRIRSEFGAFYGSNNSFKFRQFKLSGKIKNLRYEIGDIGLEMTPFTLYNFGDMYHKYESEIFQLRRSISEYENLNQGNRWLLQGAHLQYKHQFEKMALGTYGFVTRTSSTNEMNVADRLLYGGRAGLRFGNLFTVGINGVGLTDIDISTADYSYKNYVGTGDLEYLKNTDASQLKIKLEGGLSNFTNKKVVAAGLTDSAKTFQDYFVDLTGQLILKKKGLRFELNVSGVGANFSSPSAQTRRVVDNKNPSLFAMVNNASEKRAPILFDRMTSEQMYNSQIASVLSPFLNEYNNAQPYGKATPNRAGASFTIGSSKEKKNIDFELEFAYLKELVGEGTFDLRNFMVAKGGTKLELGKVFGWSRKFDFSVGARMEKTNRGGNSKIDLTSTVADAGISFEIVKKIDLVFGYKMLMANGNEYNATRNAFNSLTNFNAVEFKSNEGIYSSAVQIRFTPQQVFSIQYNLVNYKNTLLNNDSYNLSQLLFTYNGQF